MTKTPESRGRVWKKIAVFYGLTLAFSNVFNAFELLAGKMDAANLLYVTGAMWSPGLAALTTKKIFGEPIADLPWKWGGARSAWLAYLIPLAYALPVYLVVWTTPLGGFSSPASLRQTVAQFGWERLPLSLAVFLFVLLTATIGLVVNTSRALFHGSHNLLIQSILTPLTRDTGRTNYIIDEFGIGLVITVGAGALIAWRAARRDASRLIPMEVRKRA